MNTELTSPRIRFNWGFWDGCNDSRQSRTRPDWWSKRESHFDQVYVAGFEYGLDAPRDSESSDTAWFRYDTGKKATKLARKAIKDARPPMFTTRY